MTAEKEPETMRANVRFGILALWFVAPVAAVVPASAQTNDARRF